MEIQDLENIILKGDMKNMGLKTDIKGYLLKIDVFKNVRDEKVKEIKKSEVYAEEYKKELIKKENDTYTNAKAEIRNSIVKCISDSKQKLIDKKKPIVKDLAFELRLNNALKTIELAGKSINKEDLQQLVEPFKDDYTTTKSLFNILSAQGINTEGIIQPDDINGKVDLIQTLERDFLDALDHDLSLQTSIGVSYFPDDNE